MLSPDDLPEMNVPTPAPTEVPIEVPTEAPTETAPEAEQGPRSVLVGPNLDLVVKVGDWVTVRGYVASIEDVDPRDLMVQMESHEASYSAVVRRDWVESLVVPPGGWPACTHLTYVSGRSGPLAQCGRSGGHPGEHESRERTWGDEETIGFLEPVTAP